MEAYSNNERLYTAVETSNNCSVDRLANIVLITLDNVTITGPSVHNALHVQCVHDNAREMLQTTKRSTVDTIYCLQLHQCVINVVTADQ